ncbi:uncharacterized protein LOC141651512 [Silene latifolia]|uniref:uncharacterized protein LOC141651512 n=1 Tax=Silene latifolia TaxID=37657 RepID=UPI003D7770DC
MARKVISKKSHDKSKSKSKLKFKARIRLSFTNVREQFLDNSPVMSTPGSSLSNPNIPQTSQAKLTKSVNEMIGIPAIELDTIVENDLVNDSPIVEDADAIIVEDASEIGSEEAPDEGWTEVHHGKKSSPIPNSTPPILQFTADDVKPEIEYWSTAVICYVLGGNPPWNLITEHVKRIWGKYKYDKLSFLPNGVFIVRFPSLECKELVLKQGFPMFDNKPNVVKPWTEDASLHKTTIQSVPIWVRLYGLGLKFWGEKCLEKLANQLGHFVRADTATLEKTRLGYARLMIEVKVRQDFPDKLLFNDEHGCQHSVLVEYEWKPLVCSTCKGIGHTHTICRKSKVTVAPKVTQPQPAPVNSLTRSRIVNHSPIVSAVNTDPPGGGGGVSADLSYADAARSPPRSPIKSPTRALSPTPTATDTVAIGESREKGNPNTNIINDMDNLGCWNIRGMNNVNKQIDIKWWYGINNNVHHPGGRFWIIWLPQFFHVILLDNSHQQITVEVTDIHYGMKFWFTVVYSSNSDTDRLHLWQQLTGIKDRCVGAWRPGNAIRKSHFRYFNMWGQAPDFLSIIQSEWQKEVKGVKMYQVVCKLKYLKKPLKLLNRQKFSDIEKAAELAKFLLDKIQTKMHLHPHDTSIREHEQAASQNYFHLHKAQLSYLKQKAKVEWLKEGDENTTFFHRHIKANVHNKVLSIKDIHGSLQTEPDQIEAAFLEYYNDLLGTSKETVSVHYPTVRTGSLISSHHLPLLVKPVTHDEIKQCIFSIPSSKALGPDGFSSQFFKDSWSIIGTVVCEVIMDFFHTGKLLKQLNATLVTLIPKMDNPTSVLEFRPIACCNLIYKCISKLLCTRLGEVLPDTGVLIRVGLSKGEILWKMC